MTRHDYDKYGPDGEFDGGAAVGGDEVPEEGESKILYGKEQLEFLRRASENGDWPVPEKAYRPKI